MDVSYPVDLPVLISWGCFNKIPQTEWLTQQTFISHSYGACKPAIRCQHGQVLVRVYSWLAGFAAFLLCLHMVEIEQALWPLLVNVLIP